MAVSEERFDWAGSRITRWTAFPSRRRVIGNRDVLIKVDLREWISPPDSQEIREVIENLEKEGKMPTSRKKSDFDERAGAVWKYVADNITYRHDETGQHIADFWQFPHETLALGAGDCEDCALLLATLLLASGISPFCVRVVLGSLTPEGGGKVHHAWPIYKDEKGCWRVLESTVDSVPKNTKDWPLADDLARQDSLPQYYPDLCLNQHHVWTVEHHRRIRNVAAYLYSKGQLPGLYSRKRAMGRRHLDLDQM